MAKKKTKTTKRVAKKKSTKTKAFTPPKEWPPDKKRSAAIARFLARTYEPVCALDHDGPWQLLQATVLSAQCTDERVNLVTPELFRRWPDPSDMAAADPREVADVIHSTGFFNNKTKSLIGAATKVTEDFGGVVPQTMAELVTLPGVARKTANVILGTAFRKSEGFVVDTHVHRLSQRLGLTREDKPVKIEQDLMQIFSKNKWADLGHQIIWHGRTVCTARKPNCAECGLLAHCPSGPLIG